MPIGKTPENWETFVRNNYDKTKEKFRETYLKRIQETDGERLEKTARELGWETDEPENEDDILISIEPCTLSLEILFEEASKESKILQDDKRIEFLLKIAEAERILNIAIVSGNNGNEELAYAMARRSLPKINEALQLNTKSQKIGIILLDIRELAERCMDFTKELSETEDNETAEENDPEDEDLYDEDYE